MEQFIQDHVWSIQHWPFVAAVFVFMLMGQVAKTAVWTRERARQKGWAQPFWWWGYKTLPLHPVAAGAALGLFWRDPEPEVSGVAAMVYFAFAGAMSVWAYQILKGVAKRKGVYLTIPGDSSPPSCPPHEDITPVERPGTR